MFLVHDYKNKQKKKDIFPKKSINTDSLTF